VNDNDTSVDATTDTSTSGDGPNAQVTDALAAIESSDERLTYRSVFQRFFVRPEIGALMGAAGIWSFFWAVSVTFGTVGQTFGWLDIAATLGIMAVAVSMLMIGGEFDLSSGAMTGAMGMLIILMVKETGDLGGLGLPLVVAIPLSLAVALGIGYLNGYMVERTGQPSFIITLGTFFALKGLKLGLAKRFVDQIQVGRTDEASDFDFFRPIFAAEWARNEHELESRDFFYIVLIALGVCLVVLAICELWFQRRDERNPAGLVQFVVGAAIGIAGGVALHLTDGTGANAVIAAVIGIGAVVGIHGFATWRYEPQVDRGEIFLSDGLSRRLAAGLALVVAGCAVTLFLDPLSDNEIVFPLTTQGIRVILAMILIGAGATVLAMASQRALSVNAATKFAVTSAMALGMGLVAATTFIDSEAAKFRSALAPAMFGATVVVFAWAIVSSRFVERRRAEARADRLGARLLMIGLLSVVAGVAFRMLFITQAELVAEVPPAKTSVRLLWFIGFTIVMVWVLARTRFGSWTFAVGGNKEAARQTGVPAARTKTQLFMLVAFAAWLVGVLIAFRIQSIQANFGDGEEFEFIIAAVVGGTLLTGGYGTTFGGAVGACIIAMPLIGISSARWNSDWRFLLLGVILLLAVVSNRYLRLKAEAIRR
jgi:ribose/xylose/arabinose/galactoside ABC-type transport system permease subunit